MEVQRSIEQVAGRRLVLDLPESFENRTVEVIVLTLEEQQPIHPGLRRPHAALAGKMAYDDDLFDSLPLSDWGHRK